MCAVLGSLIVDPSAQHAVAACRASGWRACGGCSAQDQVEAARRRGRQAARRGAGDRLDDRRRKRYIDARKALDVLEAAAMQGRVATAATLSAAPVR